MAAPLPRRHRLDGIGLKSPAKPVNSVVMPWVDMAEDIRLIRAGHGERLPSDRWIVNGRMYVQESSPSGRMYPESGDGIVILTRSQYKALSIIQGYNAETAMIEFRLRNEDSISDADIEFVHDLLRRATT